MKTLCISLCLSVVTGACTTLPLKYGEVDKSEVHCLKHNPDVIVEGFKEEIESRLAYWGVDTVPAESSEKCDKVIKYTIYQAWDIVLYPTLAGIGVYDETGLIAVHRWLNTSLLFKYYSAGSVAKLSVDPVFSSLGKSLDVPSAGELETVLQLNY